MAQYVLTEEDLNEIRMNLMNVKLSADLSRDNSRRLDMINEIIVSKKED